MTRATLPVSVGEHNNSGAPISDHTYIKFCMRRVRAISVEKGGILFSILIWSRVSLNLSRSFDRAVPEYQDLPK